jgi:hypothetical protein
MNDLSESGGSPPGRDPEDADFSGKDLRGADFTGANLRAANFSNATLGVAPRVGVMLLVIGILISVGAGVAIGWSVDGLRHRISADRWDEVAEGSSVALILVILVAVIIWKGFDLAFKVVVAVYFTMLVINVVANLIWDEVEYVRMLRATAIVIFLVLAVAAGIFWKGRRRRLRVVVDCRRCSSRRTRFWPFRGWPCGHTGRDIACDNFEASGARRSSGSFVAQGGSPSHPSLGNQLSRC